MNGRLFRILMSLALWWLTTSGVAAAAEEIQLVNGRPQDVSGETSVTFWTEKTSLFVADAPEYKMLSGDPGVLLDGVRIEAPPEITVQQRNLTVTPRKASRSSTISPGNTTTTITYDEYRIAGSWTMTVAPGTPPSKLTVTIHLPAVAAARDALGAVEPEGETAIALSIETFPTAVSRANSRVTPEILKGFGCLLLVTLAVAGAGATLWLFTEIKSLRDLMMAGFMLALSGIVAWYSGPAFVEFMGRAVTDLREIHLAAAIGAAAGLNLLYFGLFWFAAGWGRWNKYWTIGLGAELALFVVAAALVMYLPISAPQLEDMRAGFPAALSTMLPGLALAWLVSFRHRPRGRQADPTAEQGLADVCRYLTDLSKRRE